MSIQRANGTKNLIENPHQIANLISHDSLSFFPTYSLESLVIARPICLTPHKAIILNHSPHDSPESFQETMKTIIWITQKSNSPTIWNPCIAHIVSGPKIMRGNQYPIMRVMSDFFLNANFSTGTSGSYFSGALSIAFSASLSPSLLSVLAIPTLLVLPDKSSLTP